MRLLLDECVPKRLRRELHGHDVRTVREAGWAGLKNGALLQAADGLFEVLLTVDQGVQHQQHLLGFRIGVVIAERVSARANNGVTVPLSDDELTAIRTIATSRGVDEAALIHEWVQEKLHRRGAVQHRPGADGAELTPARRGSGRTLG